MCWDCGCQIYDDDMGSDHTITDQRIVELARGQGKTREEFLEELHLALHQGNVNPAIGLPRLEQAAQDMGHDVGAAMKELHDAVHKHGYKNPNEK
jgi:hypothetical protein